jgi:hypothetical protein
MEVSKIGINDILNFSESVSRIGKNIEAKCIDKNSHIKALMEENKRDLIGMMDESYQDAFNIETKKKR